MDIRKKIMNIILRKNEAEINESVAKGLLIVFACVVLTVLLCWVGIFDIRSGMTIIMFGVSVITLVIPAVLILKFHVYHIMMKYYIVVALTVMAGTVYVLFTFQAILVFVVPSIIAAFYLDRKLLCFSGVLTVIVLFVSHWITGIYMFIPWLEPFKSMSDIMRYGALPRCVQYCGCFFLILFMMERYKKLLLQFGTDNNSKEVYETEDKEKIEFEVMLRGLTERERSVFLLMIGGYTNM